MADCDPGAERALVSVRTNIPDVLAHMSRMGPLDVHSRAGHRYAFRSTWHWEDAIK